LLKTALNNYMFDNPYHGGTAEHPISFFLHPDLWVSTVISPYTRTWANTWGKASPQAKKKEVVPQGVGLGGRDFIGIFNGYEALALPPQPR